MIQKFEKKNKTKPTTTIFVFNPFHTKSMNFLFSCIFPFSRLCVYGINCNQAADDQTNEFGDFSMQCSTYHMNIEVETLIVFIN